MADFYEDELYMSRWTEGEVADRQSLLTNGSARMLRQRHSLQSNAILPTSLVAALAVICVCVFLLCLLTTVKCVASWCVGLLLDPDELLRARKHVHHPTGAAADGDSTGHTNAVLSMQLQLDDDTDDEFMIDDYRPIVTEDPDL